MTNFLHRIRHRQAEVNWGRKLKDFVSGDGARKRISDEVSILITQIQDLVSQSPVPIKVDLIDGALSIRANGVTVTGIIEDGGASVGLQLVCRVRPVSGEGHDLVFPRTLESDGEPMWVDSFQGSRTTRQLADQILMCIVDYIDLG